MASAAPPQDDALDRLLSEGELALHGRIPWSSNATFLGEITLAEASCLVIYKPKRGARPLVDFDADTLCAREMAAYRLSLLLGWPRIPATVLRDGPAGWGSVQQVVEADLDEHYFSLRERAELYEAFKRVAAFDALANNADRKGGHVLLDDEGQVWSIDHGLCFHVAHRLRTVIWEYAGQPLGDDILADLARARGELYGTLEGLLSADEIAAVGTRLRRMLATGRHCMPRDDWRNVPYPLV